MQVEIARLETIRAASGILAKIVVALCILLLFIVLFSVLTVSAGLWIGQLLGDSALGFLVLGGAYLLLLIIIYRFREPIIARPIRNRIIASLNAGDKNG